MTPTLPARLSIAILVFASLTGRPSSGSSGEDQPGSLMARCAALTKEFDDRFEAGRKALASARTEAKAAALQWPDGHDYAAKLLALAREAPADPGALEALCWIIEQNIDIALYKEGTKIGREAAELLIRHHLDNDRLGRACLQALFRGPMPSPARDLLLPTVYEKSRNSGNRGRACLAMAQYLKYKAELLEQLRLPGGGELAAIIERMSGKEYVAKVRANDSHAVLDEAERLFARVVSEFGSLEYVFEHRHSERLRTLLEIAEPELYEIRHLATGRVAPEIAREDVDGKPMKLSDYRGKVVVLSFWGAWCGACMAMVPHERDLATRLAGRPFAMVGVNSDEDRALAKQTITRERMGWRSWSDGKVPGPIATSWNVHLWPTFFILDAKGVIRAHGVIGPEQVAKTVDALLEETEGKSLRPSGSK